MWHSMSLELKWKSFFLRMCGVIIKMREEFRNVCVLVCYFNDKWLKNFHVFCANLFY
jgi:hypothetical protein